jgi:DNA-binding NarL/FixJ family response regulator
MDASSIKTIAVLVADANAPARAGVRRALACPGFEVVGEAPEADSFVELAETLRPDVCLVEVGLPGGGIRAARAIAARLPNIAVVMLTASDSEADFFDSMRAGAAGYLLKGTDPERLPHALRGVVAGESAIPRKLLPRLLDEFRGQAGRRVPVAGGRGPQLTGREWEVLDLVRQGLATKEIAHRLFVSEVTVRRHVSAVLRKLGVKDRQAAVRLIEAA